MSERKLIFCSDTFITSVKKDLIHMIDNLGLFKSEYVLQRHVSVWKPPGYSEQNKKYPVIYIQDGQFIFLPVKTLVGWDLEPALLKLFKKNKIVETIVVAIWNTENRWLEYAPVKPVEMFFSEQEQQSLNDTGFYPDGDNYLKFIVNELKPFIDSNYSVLSDPANTFLMGSSMGAVISAYGVCEYPKVFGGAACISTHWPTYRGILVDYLDKCLPKPGNHKFYFDLSSDSIDAGYEFFQAKADVVMENHGYRSGVDWTTKKFAGDHSAAAWSRRAKFPLEFLLKN